MSNKTKAILIIMGSLVLGAVFILMLVLEDQSYNVLWEDVAEGTEDVEPGAEAEVQIFEVLLEASEKERFLEIRPRPESGWGYPKFSIGVNLEDPTGKVVAALPRDYSFRAEDADYEYDTRLSFTVPQDGVYTIYVLPRSEHIDHIRLEIREKK